MSGQLTARVSTPLRGFDLKLELSASAGKPLALVGLSGAGKTSLLRVVAGLMTARSGRVELDDQVWLDTEQGVEMPAEQRGCGFLFQDYALFPQMSAWRNVAYGIEGSWRQRRAAAVSMLDRFGVGSLAEARPPSMSGGERQRVALARALAVRPHALLLDEPLAALDSSTRRESLAELRRVLLELEAPAVLVTHSFEEAALLASTLAVVDRGGIVQCGTADEISARPASPFVADFTGASVLRGEASADGELTLVHLEGGGTVRSSDHARGPVAISIFPWEISLESPGPRPPDSVRNRVEGQITSIVSVGNRVRIGLKIPQLLSLEITGQSAAEMGLRTGERATAAWKATATRLIPLR